MTVTKIEDLPPVQIGVGTFQTSARMRQLVLQVLDSGRLTSGPMMEKFEREFARLHRSRFALMCNSGTSALQIALELQFGVRAATRRPFFNGDFSPGGRAFLWRGEKRQKIASDGFDLFADATRKLLQEFLLSIRDETVPPCSLEDNFRSFALMRAAYDAARERRDVDVATLYREDGSC